MKIDHGTSQFSDFECHQTYPSIKLNKMETERFQQTHEANIAVET